MASPMTLVYNYFPPPPAVEATAPSTPHPPNIHHAPDDPSPEPMAVDTPPPAESPRDGDTGWEVTSVTHEIRERVADLSIEQPDDHVTNFTLFDSFQQPYGQQSYPPLSDYVHQQQAQTNQLPSNQTPRRQHPPAERSSQAPASLSRTFPRTSPRASPAGA